MHTRTYSERSANKLSKLTDVMRIFITVDNMVDQCIYIKIRRIRCIFTLVHVDDTPLASSDMNLLQKSSIFLPSSSISERICIYAYVIRKSYIC